MDVAIKYFLILNSYLKQWLFYQEPKIKLEYNTMMSHAIWKQHI